jgi:Sporulation related domain.
MNKVSHLTLLLLPVVLLATGCDFFRKLAGGPTSGDLAVMAAAIKSREEEAQKAKLAAQAAEEAVRRYRSDSLAAVEALSHEVVHTPERFGGVAAAELSNRYYIIIGSFSDKANAERLAGKMSDAGFPAVTVPFGNNLSGVGLCGTDDVVSIARSIEEVKRQDFCPAGVWILDNIKK